MRKELKKYENINCNYTELYDSYIGAPQSYNDKNTYDLTGSPNKNNLSLAINNGGVQDCKIVEANIAIDPFSFDT